MLPHPIELRRVERDGHSIRVEHVDPVPGIAGGAADPGLHGRRVVVTFIGCPGLELRATPGRGVPLMQDAVLGLAAFDDRYVVKTPDVEVARFWLGQPELAAIVATHDQTESSGFELDIHAGVLRMSVDCPTPEGTADGENVMITAAAALAAREPRELAAWRARATELGGALVGDRWTWTDELAITVDSDEIAAIRIDFALEVPWTPDRRPRTAITARRPEEGAPIVALCRPDAPRRHRPRLARGKHRDISIAHIAGELAVAAPDLPPIDKHVAAAGLDWLVIDERAITAGWDSVPRSTPIIAAGLAAVRALAEQLAPARADGPYR